MALVLLASLVAYCTTEIDDLLVMFVLFGRTKNKSDKICVIVGKYIGLALVVGCSSLFAVYISKIPAYFVGFLGLVPVAIGIKTFFEKHTAVDVENKTAIAKTQSLAQKITLVVETVVVTLASSGDNIAIYIPFFASLHGLDYVVMIIVFVVMQAVLCTIGILVVNMKPIQCFFARWYKIIIPVLFILLGVYIMFKEGTILWIVREMQFGAQ